MQTEIWFRDDVVNALRAVAEAGAAAAMALHSENAYSQGYQQGFAAALRAVGVAFGLASSLEDSATFPQRPRKRWEVEAWRS
ncbi:MAG: hypothetical protein ACUVXG_04205 [Anaerolineae bacterium]